MCGADRGPWNQVPSAFLKDGRDAYRYTSIAMDQRSGKYPRHAARLLGFLIAVQQIVTAQSVANVLRGVNDASPLSRDIGRYYTSRRGLPPKNICHIRTASTEVIERAQYDREIAGPIGGCLTRNHLTEQILY